MGNSAIREGTSPIRTTRCSILREEHSCHQKRPRAVRNTGVRAVARLKCITCLYVRRVPAFASANMKLGLSALVLHVDNADRERYCVESLYQAEGDGGAEWQVNVFELPIQTRAIGASLEVTAQLSFDTVDHGFAARSQANLTTRGWRRCGRTGRWTCSRARCWRPRRTGHGCWTCHRTRPVR